MAKKETYEEYKIRKEITNVHQATIILGLDAIKLTAEKFKEAHRILQLKNK